MNKKLLLSLMLLSPLAHAEILSVEQAKSYAYFYFAHPKQRLHVVGDHQVLIKNNTNQEHQYQATYTLTSYYVSERITKNYTLKPGESTSDKYQSTLDITTGKDEISTMYYVITEIKSDDNQWSINISQNNIYIG